MTLQHVMWAGLALTLVGTALGCREWYRGRGAREALTSIPGIAVYIVLLTGSDNPWLAGVSLLVAVGFLVYAMATTQHRIPWQSAPGICFVLLAVLFAVMVALPGDAPRALTAVFYALMVVLVATGAAVFWMLYKAMVRSRSISR